MKGLLIDCKNIYFVTSLAHLFMTIVGWVIVCPPPACLRVAWPPPGGPASWPGLRPRYRWAAPPSRSGTAGHRRYSAPRPYLTRLYPATTDANFKMQK